MMLLIYNAGRGHIQFIGQVNGFLGFFNKLDFFVKIKLFKSFCSSMYGAKLWPLNNGAIDEVCTAWRKALRRAMNLPCNCHCFLLPVLSDTIPICAEICKRSSRFI